MKQIFNPGDKFKLKDWVGYEDLQNISFSDYDHIEFLLNQENFTVIKVPKYYESYLNRVWFLSSYCGSFAYFTKNMCELIESRPLRDHNHPMTRIFSDIKIEKQEELELKG